MLVFTTNSLATPPVRVRLEAVGRPARANVSAPPQTAPQPPAPPVDALGPRPPTVVPAATPSTLPDAPRWVWPVSAAAGWLAAIILLTVLAVRFPTSTWPEQLGIVAGLWGVVVFGLWWPGAVAWAVARLVHWFVHNAAPSSHPVPAQT
jgi:hypothetical protein